jgi:hypothetical protein
MQTFNDRCFDEESHDNAHEDFDGYPFEKRDVSILFVSILICYEVLLYCCHWKNYVVTFFEFKCGRKIQSYCWKI